MSKIRAQIPIYASIVITVICIFGVGFMFRLNSGKIIDSAVVGSLEDSCKAQAVAFSMRLKDQTLVLESDAHFFENVDMDDFVEVGKILSMIGREALFNTIGVADSRGRSLDVNGVETDVREFEFFRRSMAGKTAVVKSDFSDFNYWDALVLSAPIMRNGMVVGVIYGIFTNEELNSVIEGFSYDDKMASLLFGSDGTILARSNNPVLVTNRIVNFFDIGTSWGLHGNDTLESLKIDLEKNQSVVIPYQTGTKKRLAIMTPVGIHDWYYAIVTHQSVITDIIDTLSFHVIIIEVILVLAFSLLLFSILFLLKNNDSINRMNEKFRIATKQNQTVVFDFDCEKCAIEFNGDTEFIFGEQVDRIESKDFPILQRLIHEDDFSLFKALRNFNKDNLDTVNREFRMKCFDGNYYWFKMLGTFIKNQDGSPRKLVGNLANVDDVINKERILKQKAENDALTGLLNKGTFQERVEGVLANAKKDDLYAFYIIDLDNFKKVNDSMGHIVGDKVLSDTAQKLCVVFSDEDFVGRIGGDEFTAFLKLTSDGKRIGEKIIRSKAAAICEKLNEVYTNGNVKVNVSSSVGIALYPEHGQKYNDLYKNADSALYLSKNGGKNQFHIFNTVL